MPISKVSQAGLSSGAQFSAFKNRIINGGMDIDQRNAGASVTINTNPVYTIDRWYGGKAGTINNFTIQRSSTAPTGFQNSLVITAGTASTPAASDFGFLSQAIEGFNFADLGWGAAGAQSVTISFWVRSSLTGTFGMGLRNGVANRAYIASYTINSANTWEYKTVTIAGDTTGTWATDNTQACGVFFDIGCGSNFSSTAGSWSSSNLLGGLTGGVKLVATTGATMNITGVQLEKGSTATSFDYRPYGTELALCQRYYAKSYDINTTPGTITDNGAFLLQPGGTITTGMFTTVNFPVEMRSAPTITTYSPTAGTSGNINKGTTVVTSGINWTSTRSTYIGTSSTTSATYIAGHWTASIEL